MDKDRLEEARKQQAATNAAMNMMLDMMEAIMPEDLQPMIQLPKLCSRIDIKINAILRMVVDKDGFDNSVKLASEANVLLSRVDEALEAFIDQHKPNTNIAEN